MPTTDLCLGNIYEPGNIPSTSGEPPVRPTPGFQPSLDFSKAQNSLYFFLLFVW